MVAIWWERLVWLTFCSCRNLLASLCSRLCAQVYIELSLANQEVTCSGFGIHGSVLILDVCVASIENFWASLVIYLFMFLQLWITAVTLQIPACIAITWVFCDVWTFGLNSTFAAWRSGSTTSIWVAGSSNQIGILVTLHHRDVKVMVCLNRWSCCLFPYYFQASQQVPGWGYEIYCKHLTSLRTRSFACQIRILRGTFSYIMVLFC